jgi:integrase
MGEQVYVQNKLLPDGGYFEILTENSCDNINKTSINPYIGCEAADHSQGAMQSVSGCEKPFSLLLESSDEEIYAWARTLPKHQQVRVQKIIGVARKHCFPQGPVRSVDLPRGFTRDQLLRFMREVLRFHNTKVFVACVLALLYGLRESEIALLKVVPGQRIVCIWDEKMDRREYLPLILGTEDMIRYYSSAPLSKDYLRKYFRETCVRLGDEFMYGEPGKVGQQCYQFTFHSLRHTGGELFRDFTNIEFKMHVFLRHNLRSVYGSTGYYMRYRREDMFVDVNECFCSLLSLLLDIH